MPMKSKRDEIPSDETRREALPDPKKSKDSRQGIGTARRAASRKGYLLRRRKTRALSNATGAFGRDPPRENTDAKKTGEGRGNSRLEEDPMDQSGRRRATNGRKSFIIYAHRGATQQSTSAERVKDLMVTSDEGRIRKGIKSPPKQRKELRRYKGGENQ